MGEVESRTKARSAAVKALLGSIGRSRPLRNLSTHPAVAGLDSVEKGYASEIVYGVLRNLLRYDFLISSHSGDRFERIDKEILWILRTALYQLEFMSAPDYAVVNDAVQIARYFGKSSASSFVNGLLRSFLRRRHPLPTGNSVSSLSIRYSHPEWLVKRYLSRYGIKKTRLLMSTNNKPPDSYLRININKISREEFKKALDDEGISYQEFPEIPGGLKISHRGFNRHRLYQQGCCHYMDYGSQLIAEKLAAEPGMNIGDLCAAPGGKSFILASRVGDSGLVVSSDVNRTRIVEMKKRMELYRIENCSLFCCDLEAGPPPVRNLDLIFVDAPCSGLGTIRSNPDIRWLVTGQDLVRHHDRQTKMIRNCYRSLEKGRVLYYSTCSTEPEENQQVIERLLGEELTSELVNEPFDTWSGQWQGEGFYMAGIRKRRQ